MGFKRNQDNSKAQTMQVLQKFTKARSGVIWEYRNKKKRDEIVSISTRLRDKRNENVYKQNIKLKVTTTLGGR